MYYIYVYFEVHFLKRPRLKNLEKYFFATRKICFFIRYAQFLGAIFFGTFWISTNRAHTSCLYNTLNKGLLEIPCGSLGPKDFVVTPLRIFASRQISLERPEITLKTPMKRAAKDPSPKSNYILNRKDTNKEGV